MDEEIKKETKGPLGKLKEKVEDSEEQLAILSTFVRLGILIWSGGILTLAYIKLPPALGIPEQKLDPTFIDPLFLLGFWITFGVQTAKKNGANGASGGGISKADLERLIAADAQTAPAQTIRIEQAPIQFSTKDGEPPVKPTTPHLQKKSDECAEIYREWEKMFLDLETRHSKKQKTKKMVQMCYRIW